MKYKITFKKRYKESSPSTYRCVTDGAIIAVFSALQEKGLIRVVKMDIKDVFGTSTIIVKCSKKEILNVCNLFTTALNGDIIRFNYRPLLF